VLLTLGSCVEVKAEKYSTNLEGGPVLPAPQPA
jgi:hypothetical protein